MKPQAEDGLTIYKVYRIISTAVSLVIFIGLTFYSFYHSFQEELNLYNWHPSLMTLGFTLLMAEGILVMSKDSFFTLFKFDREQKVTLHWILLTLSGISVMTGFAAMVLLKEQGNHSHFETWHATAGLTATILGFISAALGVLALYSSLIKNYVNPSLIKLIHIFLGVLCFGLGILAESYGFYTRRFIKRSSESTAFICAILLMVSSFFAIENALKTTYFKAKKVFFKPSGPGKADKKAK